MAVIAWAIASPTLARAAVTFSATAGGTGGDAFTLNCPAGRVLNGITGRAGDFIDQVRGVCTQIDEIGDVVATTNTARRGGSGGTAFDLRCPRGHAVVGLRGRSGFFVDRLQLVCAAVDGDGSVLPSSESVDQFRAGGSGGDAFKLHCPGDTPARGLRGRAGSFVDQIGLTCQNAEFAPVTPTSATRPDLRVVVRDLPFRVHANDQVEYTVSLWNVGGTAAPEGTEMDLGTSFPISFPIIDAGFLGNAGCDVHNPPPHKIVRCETAGPTASLDVRMSVTVTFTANGPTGSFSFDGQADPRNLVTEGNESNNTSAPVLRIVN